MRKRSPFARGVKIQYLNTDLDLSSASDLTPLATALDARGVFPLHVTHCGDEWYTTFEVSAEEWMGEPELTLRAMLDAIDGLEVEATDLWSGCSKREFNIGYDCGSEPWAFNNGLTNETLKRIADRGASLRITLYPPAPDGG